MKEKILKGCNSIPVVNLINYIQNGNVSIPELITAGLSKDKVNKIETAIQAEENQLWDKTSKTDTVEAYNNYIQKFSSGAHSSEALTRLLNLDDKYWQNAIIQQTISESSLNDYKKKFPNGKHLQECDDMLSDLPWLQTKSRNTIQAYEKYRCNYPSNHTQEINQLINDLNDDNDWGNACSINTTDAYHRYIHFHQNGVHTNEAQSRIQSRAGHDEFINKLKRDPNAYYAKDIQKKVENGVATWDDIQSVFGVDEAEAIKSFKNPSGLPESIPPEKLQDNSTEVYFWGTPSSGKTCALGSVISSSQSKGIFEPLQCSGYDYMIRLSNIFDKRGFCIFPDSTSIENIQEMIMHLTDEKGKQHKLTLIDLAGELFRSAYFKQHNLFLGKVEEATLNTAMNYLKDDRNKKIHFFVVEYGAQDNEWEGLRMVNYLDNMIGFLKQKQVFKKSTVGVYVLVTKCDKIDCSPVDRPKQAFRYVSKELPSFWNTLQTTCKATGVADLKVLSYSVGDVFTQNICKFNERDTSKVIEKLLTKTRSNGSIWDLFRE